MASQIQGAPASSTLADGRATLMDLFADGRRDEFVDVGYRFLARIDDDPEIALLVLKSLVEAGLGGPARELLQYRGDLAVSESQIAELRKAVALVPIPRVPWESLERQYEANQEVLLAGRPYLNDTAGTLRDSLRNHQLFRDADGELHLALIQDGRMCRWNPTFHDPARSDAGRPHLDPAGRPVVVIGTGLSRLVEDVYEATQPADGLGTVAVYVIDDDPARVAAWLHTADRTAILAADRVSFFVGPDALAQFERFLAERDDLQLPEVSVAPAWAAGLGRELAVIARRLATQRGKAMSELAGTLRRRAAQRTAADWADRLKPGATIVGFAARATTMLQYSMRDIGHAFEALGYRFKLCIEGADHCVHSTLTTARYLSEADPALVVLINHFRYEQPDALAGAPLLTWIQDPTEVVLSRRTGESIGPLDFVCGYYVVRCTQEFGYPASRFFTAPLPVSTRTFHDGPVEPDEAGRYDCDLIYVGHLHEDADAHLARWRSVTPAHLHPLLDAIRDEVYSAHRQDTHIQVPRPMVQRLAGDLGFTLDEDNIENISNYFSYRLYDILYRCQTLQWAAEWAERTGRVFRLYGRGWSRIAELAPYAAGPIEHGEPLRRAYRCARLALSTMPRGFRHQRAFEALMSGSLVIARHVPPDFGERGASVFPRLGEIVFRNADELAHLADSLLDDRRRVGELRNAFAEIVRNEFSYAAVVPDLLDKIRSSLAGC